MTQWLNVLKKYAVKFGCIGVINTGVQHVLYGLFIVGRMNYLLAQGLSFGVALMVSFVLNAKWNYQVSLSVQKGFTFLMANLPSFFLQAILLSLLVQVFKVREEIALLCTLFFTIPLSFILITRGMLKKK